MRWGGGPLTVALLVTVRSDGTAFLPKLREGAAKNGNGASRPASTADRGALPCPAFGSELGQSLEWTCIAAVRLHGLALRPSPDAAQPVGLPG